MNTTTTELVGWVLEAEAYREKDTRIGLLTPSGYLSLFVRASQTMKSKNRHLCMPMSKVNLLIKGQQVLSGRLLAQPVGYHDLTSLSMLAVVIEFIHETHQSELYYPWVSAWLDSHASLTAFALLIARHLTYSGIAPYVDGCVICQKGQVIDFSSQAGGFVCRQHAHGQLSKAQLKGLYRLFHLKPDQEDLFLKSYTIDVQQVACLIEFWQHYGTKGAKSAQFLLSNLSL